MIQPKELEFNNEARLVIDDACAGCPTTNALTDIYSSDDPEWFDMNSRKMTSRILLEAVYRNCPARIMTSVPAWKRIGMKLLGSEPLGVRMANEATRDKEPGRFHPCGLDKEPSIDR